MIMSFGVVVLHTLQMPCVMYTEYVVHTDRSCINSFALFQEISIHVLIIQFFCDLSHSILSKYNLTLQFPLASFLFIF